MTSFTVPGSRNGSVAMMSGLFALALYINLSKIVLGSRYFMLAGDILLGLFAFAALLAYSDRRKLLGPIELLVGSFVVIGVFQLFNPNVPSLQVGLEGYRRLMFQMLGLLVGITIIRSRGDIVSLWKLLGLCSLPILLYAIKQFFVISDFDTAIIESNTADIDTWRIFGKTRAFGLFNGPFHLGTFAGLMFWVAIALRLHTGQKRYSALAGIAICACVASLTRANIIALAASVPICLFIVLRQQRRKVIAITVASVLSVTLLGWIAYYTLPDVQVALEGYSAVESLQNDGRLQGRFDGYAQAAQMMREYPLGAGMSSAGDATGPEFESKGLLHITSHNMLLWVAVETGIPGLLIFIAILAYIAQSVFRLTQRHETTLAIAAAGPFLVILISGLTGSTLSAYPVNLIFWTLAGCYIGYLRLPRSAGPGGTL